MLNLKQQIESEITRPLERRTSASIKALEERVLQLEKNMSHAVKAFETIVEIFNKDKK